MKKILTVGILAALQSVVAAESFGGIGLAIYPSERGAEVAGVVQGAPAHLAGIEIGDFLILADGVSLEGKSLDFDMEVLRGSPNETVELTVLRNADTLRVPVRREAIAVKASGESSGMAFKTASHENWQFLDAVELPDLKADVYAKMSGSFGETSPISRMDSKSFLALKSFDRNFIQFELASSGHATLDVFSPLGGKVESLRMEGVAGLNRLAWNGAALPAGNYFVRICQKGKNLYYKGVLR